MSTAPHRIPQKDVEILGEIVGGKLGVDFGGSGRSGASGKVLKGFWKKRERFVAVKFMHTITGPGSDEYNKSRKKEALNEAKQYQKINHPQIIEFYGVIECTNKNPKKEDKEKYDISAVECVHLVEEWVDGSLSELLKDCEKKIEILDEMAKVQIALDIAVGVNYLHTDAKIVHRDLKPHNILIETITKDSHKERRAKLCDFGTARCLNRKTGQKYVGTVDYVAPEVRSEVDAEDDGGKRKGSPEADVFSVGVVLWCIYFEHVGPGAPITSSKDLLSQCSIGEDDLVAKEIFGIVESCCKEDPKERIAMKTVVELLKGMLKRLKCKDYGKLEAKDKEIAALKGSVGVLEKALMKKTLMNKSLMKEIDAQRELIRELKRSLKIAHKDCSECISNSGMTLIPIPGRFRFIITSHIDDAIKFSDNGMKATGTRKQSTPLDRLKKLVRKNHGFRTFIGNVSFDSGKKWYFQVKLKVGNGNVMRVGVVNGEVNPRILLEEQMSGWAFSCRSSTTTSSVLSAVEFGGTGKKEYGPKTGKSLAEEYTLGVLVDFSSGEELFGTVKFFVNGKDWGIAFTKVKPPVSPAFTLKYKEDSIELYGEQYEVPEEGPVTREGRKTRKHQ